MDIYKNKEEVLKDGFNEEELEYAISMYETDFDKLFFNGYLYKPEQKEYLLKARIFLKQNERKER